MRVQSRGSTRDGTGVHDSIVNQLLTKVSVNAFMIKITTLLKYSSVYLRNNPPDLQIDGVESLNNVLLIGMTNRKDMLDEALLRSLNLPSLVPGFFNMLIMENINVNTHQGYAIVYCAL